MGLPQDYGFVPGRDRKVAFKLLELAKDLELEPGVVGALSRNPDGTPGGGYQVPNALLEKYQEFLKGESEAIDSDDKGTDDSKTVTPVATVTDADGNNVVVPPSGGTPAQIVNADGSLPVTGDDGLQIAGTTDPATVPDATITETPAPVEGTEVAPGETEAAATGTEAAETETVATVLPEPPRSGAGSSIDAWIEYARTQPTWVESDADDLGRNDFIAKYGKPAE